MTEKQQTEYDSLPTRKTVFLHCGYICGTERISDGSVDVYEKRGRKGYYEAIRYPTAKKAIAALASFMDFPGYRKFYRSYALETRFPEKWPKLRPWTEQDGERLYVD